ncbi:IST1-like protein isoform X1 [Canna indica]|uniref:IST1-like protein isoform X1 n=1 Tax=Canna indica TaxID=4628 RepID=A0AAQ3JQ01_9LILI|nr:IST1-like protein isoform X1 [Canna indica]
MASECKSSSIRAVQKLMGAGASAILHRGFNSSKCKTEAKMATARIKLLRNKREAQLRQMRRDIAFLLESGRDETARIRVEHVIREQNVLAANEIIELFCELIVARLPIISKQRDCPPDLKEGISSLIYASPRCSEIPELNRIQRLFEKKYGKDFVAAAIDLRPESGVNRMLIEKLSVRKPTGEFKLKVLKEIAKEYQVKWDATESEQELLKPPEEVIEGPRTFNNDTSFPGKPTLLRNDTQTNGTSFPVNATLSQHDIQPNEHYFRSNNNKEDSVLQFKDPVSAAQAAAESAEKAIHAAQAAAHFANQNSHPFDRTTHVHTTISSQNKLNQRELQRQSLGSGQPFGTINDPSIYEAKPPRKFVSSQSFNVSNNLDGDNMDNMNLDEQKILRRNSCTPRTVHSDIKFDDSDGLESDVDEELEVESPPPPKSDPPPSRPAPVLPSQRGRSEEPYDDKYSESAKVNTSAHVHPKLPDYEALAARFEALKLRRI